MGERRGKGESSTERDDASRFGGRNSSSFLLLLPLLRLPFYISIVPLVDIVFQSGLGLQEMENLVDERTEPSVESRVIRDRSLPSRASQERELKGIFFSSLLPEESDGKQDMNGT